MSAHRRSALALGVTGLSLVLVAQAQASEPEATGALLYRIYCLNCHGESGRGDGPLAPLLTVEPADLRLIRSRNGGVFPTDRVHRTIDGRSAVTGHGSREMPLWGLAFQEADLDANQERQVRARIVALTEHIESLQEAPKRGPAD
jgi:mono/diheme cytochrome c family protein